MAYNVEDAVRIASESGVLSLLAPLSENPRSGLEGPAVALKGWDVLGGGLSALCGCSAWPSHDGVTLVAGNKVLLRLLSPSAWESGVIARQVAESVTGLQFPSSAAAIARQLWENVGPPDCWRQEEGIDLLKLPGTFYVRAIPGEYNDVVKYDLANAYGSIIGRLPSPYIKPYKSGTIKWRRGSRLDAIAWEHLQECSIRTKHIGRALYGTAAGKDKKQRRWHDGKKSHQQLPSGPFPLVARLVERIAHEVCQLAAQGTNACYGYTDCVMSTEGAAAGVAIWDHAGLEYKNKGEGDGHIINPVCYRIGDYGTAHYRKGIQGETPNPHARYNTTIELVNGDHQPEQLFSAFLLVGG